MSAVRTALKHSVGCMLGTVSRRLSPASAADARRQPPIRLFWWRDRVNFGDALNPEIVAAVAGRPVEWASLKTCNLCAIGSVYGWLRTHSSRYMRDVHIWGSGLMRPSESVGTTDYLHHHLVRGPLTAIAAEDDTIPTGDPGLLAADVFGIRQTPGATGIGVVPHRSQWDDRALIEHISARPDIRLIDLRTEDCKAVVEAIAHCEMIFTSSLHGLIVADSLGIPNYYMERNNFGSPAHYFKFYDYSLSVGRILGDFFKTPPGKDFPHDRRPAMFDYLVGIEAKKTEIRGAFPQGVFAQSEA